MVSAPSTMNTLRRPSNGLRAASRCNSAMCSIRMFLRVLDELPWSDPEPPSALGSSVSTSITRTSAWRPREMRSQDSHLPHGGCGVSPNRSVDGVQFAARAMSIASVRLPTCSGPETR